MCWYLRSEKKGMSRTPGSKNIVQLPTSYDMGCPAVNLVMAVVARAKADEGTEYANGFWSEFKKTNTYKKGLRGSLNVLSMACGLGSYWWG